MVYSGYRKMSNSLKISEPFHVTKMEKQVLRILFNIYEFPTIQQNKYKEKKDTQLFYKLKKKPIKINLN